MKTIKGLRSEFKKANNRLDKAIEKYRKALLPLWYLGADGKLRDAFKAAFRYYDGAWHYRKNVTEIADKFYRRGRGEKMLAEMWGRFEPVAVKPVAIENLFKIEREIDSACDNREAAFTALEDLSVDVFADDDLWA